MNLDLAEKIGGRSNESPLTLLGEQQALALGIHLKNALSQQGCPAHTLKYFASTSKRSIDTAKLAMKELEINPNEHLVCTDALLEQDMGDWEGAMRSSCYTPEILDLINADTHNYASPGGESQRQVEERMIDYLLRKVLPASQPGCPSLVFGHGMAFKTVLRHILSSDPRMSRKIAIGNTAVTELGFVPDDAPPHLQPGWHILRVNDMTHLNTVAD